MKIRTDVQASDVLHDARHTLFVEGKDGTQIDPQVIRELLRSNDLTTIDVQTMGACDNVRSAAEALHKHHPRFYFLIDRDDQKDETVEKSWRSFPDPEQHNLLIWRKRELENYFIDPDYLTKSRFQKPNVDIAEKILTECNSRLFLDCANLTLLWLERELRQPLAIKHFANKSEFVQKEAAEQKIQQLARLCERKDEINLTLDSTKVTEVFQGFVTELSGGTLPLAYGTGTWLERMSGKEVFNAIANECFEVHDNMGKLQRGKQQRMDIATDLVRKPLNQQPQDFQNLLTLLKERLHSPF